MNHRQCNIHSVEWNFNCQLLEGNTILFEHGIWICFDKELSKSRSMFIKAEEIVSIVNL